jgi:hypothetical protein
MQYPDSLRIRPQPLAKRHEPDSTVAMIRAGFLDSSRHDLIERFARIDFSMVYAPICTEIRTIWLRCRRLEQRLPGLMKVPRFHGLPCRTAEAVVYLVGIMCFSGGHRQSHFRTVGRTVGGRADGEPLEGAGS